MGAIPERNVDIVMLDHVPWYGWRDNLGDTVTFADIKNRLVQVGAEVALAPVYAENPWEPGLAEVESKRAVVARNGSTLGIHSGKYGIVQTSTVVEMAEMLMADPDVAPLVGALKGMVSIDRGAKFVLTLELAETVDLGFTKVSGYVSFGGSHDGSMAITARDVRGVSVCENTIQAYFLGAPTMLKVRHTSNAEELALDASKALVESFRATRTVAQVAERLLNEAFSETDFRNLTKDILGPIPEDEGRKRTTWQNTYSGIVSRYQGDDIAAQGVAETKWGALMAFQGYEQWLKPSRGEKRQARHWLNTNFGTPADFPLTMAASKRLGVKALATA